MNISFGSGLVQIFLSWSSFLSTISAKAIAPQYVEDDEKYVIFSIEGSVVYFTEIYKSTPPENIDADINAASKTSFEAGLKEKCNKAAVHKTLDGRTRVALEKGTSKKLNFFSHDWSDPTTWYTGSTRVVDEVATDSGDHTTYNLAHTNVIDLYHGKIYQEDFLTDAGGHSYKIIVKVNGTTKTEQNPHYGSGGDYTVNYVDGKIIFLSALQANDEIKVTYFYAGSSVFIVAPTAGSQISIDFVECQFSDDIVMNDSVLFQPYGFVECFAPQYCTVNGGPYPPGTKIPLGTPLKYKSFTDFQAEATKAYVQYPAMGGNNWRAATQKLTIINWDYLAATLLKSSQGLEVRISLEHDVPFGGWYATATFYCRLDEE